MCGFPGASSYEDILYSAFVKLMETVQKRSGKIFLNLTINDFKNNSTDLSETIKKETWGGNVPHCVTCVERQSELSIDWTCEQSTR